MSLIDREPLGQKMPKPVRSKKLRDAVKALPCVICHAPPPSDCHHVFHDRFSRARECDTKTIPLCKRHHQEGPDAIHNDKKGWRERYGADYEYLPVVADMLNGEWNP